MLGSVRLTEGPFVAVDIEATGARPGTHEMIEIGAVRIERGRIVERFESLIRRSKPGPMPPVIVALTGIHDAMLAGAPTLDEVLDSFRTFADGSVLVAHNHRFDLGFLDYESELRWREPFPRPVLDTLVLARRLHPAEDRHNLRDLAARYATAVRPVHRAGGDAQATAEILLGMLPQLLARGMECAADVAAFCGMDRQGELSSKLVLTTSLPSKPGLYMFRDADGRVVHVGRAKDLRARVRSYFYGSTGQGRPPVAACTESIQWVECASDLDALLLESRLVTRYRPPHNPLIMRGDRGPWVLTATKGRYPALKVTSRPAADGAAGPFASEGALEVVAYQLRRDFGLRRCTRRLTAKSPRVKCAHRDEGHCPRPCVESPDPAAYEERVEAALSAFSSGERAFRESLRDKLASSAREMRYEEAIRFRDTLKAFERSVSALRTVEAAMRDPGFAIVEGDAETIAIHLVRRGYLVRTVRVRRDRILDPALVVRLRRLLATHFPAAPSAEDPRLVTSRQLRDVFLISSYRMQHTPLEIPLTEGPDAALPRLLSAIGARETATGAA